MKLVISVLFGLTMLLDSYGQVKEAAKNLKQQAAKMGAAFLSSDYKIFAKYTNPEIVKLMGGEVKLANVLTKTINDMKAKGMSFKSITFAEPSVIVKSRRELQCTILQHTELNTSPGRAISTSTLIAISTDNGNNWTFIDTSGKDITTLRKALPDLSSSITIPLQQPPVRY